MGKGASICTYEATRACALQDGQMFSFTDATIDEEDGDSKDNSADVPPPFSLGNMADKHVYPAPRASKLHSVPPDKEEQIMWPQGTTGYQCERKSNGHWL